MQILEFDNSDPKLNLADPRVIGYAGKDYLTTMSHLRLVASDDGINFREDPSYPPMFGQGELESYGIEDCRVTQIGETYYLTFTQVSEHGVGVGLRSTTDWRNIRQHGMILPAPQQGLRDLQRTNRRQILRSASPQQPNPRRQLHLARRIARPRALGQPSLPRPQPAGHVGQRPRRRRGRPHPHAGGLAGNLPRRQRPTTATASARCCSISKSPWKVLARSREPIMEPIADYERTGFFGNVVFTNGHVVDGDTVTLYYGASDSVICGARLSIQEILQTSPFDAAA